MASILKILFGTQNVDKHMPYFLHFSGEGSSYSGNSDERNLQAMGRAISVHPDTLKVMYFA